MQATTATGLCVRECRKHLTRNLLVEITNNISYPRRHGKSAKNVKYWEKESKNNNIQKFQDKALSSHFT